VDDIAADAMPADTPELQDSSSDPSTGRDDLPDADADPDGTTPDVAPDAAPDSDSDSADAADSTGAPNLVLVVLEDVEDVEVVEVVEVVEPWIGATGDIAPIPTLTGLADNGVVFTTAWATPTCSPTRWGLHTGFYPSHGGPLGPNGTGPSPASPDVLRRRVGRRFGRRVRQQPDLFPGSDLGHRQRVGPLPRRGRRAR
jgi:hypothetical protein